MTTPFSEGGLGSLPFAGTAPVVAGLASAAAWSSLAFFLASSASCSLAAISVTPVSQPTSLTFGNNATAATGVPLRKVLEAVG